MPQPKGTLCFYHSNYPADIIIRMGSGAYYSHVAVANGNGSAICAWAGGGGMASGVIDTYADSSLMCEHIPFPGDVDKFLIVLHMQLGKPYDFVGWVSDPIRNIFGVNVGGGVPDRFHCASLVAYCWTAVTGKDWGKPFRAVTPQDVYNASRF
jgi:hypothetical protein